MKEDEALTIRAVENGFIVTREVGMHESISVCDTMVFRTMAELCDFIEMHYTHRSRVEMND